MRWEGQSRTSYDDAALPGMARIANLVRSVSTPEFRGITFHEVLAKSALNRVPGQALPFDWTINPYRGCSHACTYCAVGETPVLMADGTSRPLGELSVGDRIYGTLRDRNGRHFVTTQVLAHWETVKHAFRLTLEDGRRLVTSGDHRFLTDGGWRYVTSGSTGRLHLAPGSLLVAVDLTVGRRQPAPSAPDEIAPRLAVASIEDLGHELPMYDITTGTSDFIADGVVSHNCFARPTHQYLELDMGEDFDRQIVVKTNVVDVLRRELARPSWRRETVALGTNTDPYQRAEGRYRLMPGIIDALAASGTPFSILTKGPLLRRDLGRLTAAAERVKVGVGVSIALADEELHESMEPGAPTPRARLDLVRAIRDAGLPCGVMVAPVLPWLTDSDDQLEELFARLADAGASGVTPLVLHLRPGTKEWFMTWLAREHPELVGRYEQLYGRGAYAPPSFQRAFDERVKPLLHKHGFGRSSRHRDVDARRPDAEFAGSADRPSETGVPVFEQQSLF
jgi:DNA repair photolyase